MRFLFLSVTQKVFIKKDGKKGNVLHYKVYKEVDPNKNNQATRRETSRRDET